MKICQNILAITVICTTTIASHNALAAIITETFSFTASGFVDFSGLASTPPPYQDASGSFTITFDPTAVYLADTTAGLIVNSFSPSVLAQSGISFVYDPTQGGTLDIGGLDDTVRAEGFGDNDFVVGIANVQNDPRLEAMNHTTEGYPGAGQNTSGSLTATVVPEPSMVFSLSFATTVMVLARRPRLQGVYRRAIFGRGRSLEG